MKIIKATEKELDIINEIVSKTIRISYGECYNQEIVEFFLMIHSKKRILQDILHHSMYLIEDNGEYVGTGCAKDDHITRVYILPQFHGKGYGTAVMDLLEKEISQKYDEAFLDPSSSAIPFYERRGYQIISHEDCKMKQGSVLPHDVMKKKLR